MYNSTDNMNEMVQKRFCFNKSIIPRPQSLLIRNDSNYEMISTFKTSNETSTTNTKDAQIIIHPAIVKSIHKYKSLDSININHKLDDKNGQLLRPKLFISKTNLVNNDDDYLKTFKSTIKLSQTSSIYIKCLTRQNQKNCLKKRRKLVSPPPPMFISSSGLLPPPPPQSLIKQ
jgi:hypothetical protein